MTDQKSQKDLIKGGLYKLSGEVDSVGGIIYTISPDILKFIDTTLIVDDWNKFVVSVCLSTKSLEPLPFLYLGRLQLDHKGEFENEWMYFFLCNGKIIFPSIYMKENIHKFFTLISDPQ